MQSKTTRLLIARLPDQWLFTKGYEPMTNQTARHLIRLDTGQPHGVYVSAGDRPAYYVRRKGSGDIERAEGLDLKRLTQEIGPPPAYPVPRPIVRSDLRDALEERRRLMNGTRSGRRYEY